MPGVAGVGDRSVRTSSAANSAELVTAEHVYLALITPPDHPADPPDNQPEPGERRWPR